MMDPAYAGSGRSWSRPCTGRIESFALIDSDREHQVLTTPGCGTSTSPGPLGESRPAYQLFSASVTVGAPLASVVRQSRRPRF